MPASQPRLRSPYTHVALMGDIVASEANPSVPRLHQTFNAAVHQANDRFAGDIAVPLTITLGDEFQGLCSSLSAGLRVMRHVRHELLSRRVECRFALGLVRLESPAPQDRAWNMMGPGLASTREKLTAKAHPNAYRFHLPDEPLLEQLLEAIGYSVTLTERDWTDRQQEVSLAALAHEGRASQLASELGLATRTFYKIRSSARLDFYESQWRAMTAAMGDLDERYRFPGA